MLILVFFAHASFVSFLVLIATVPIILYSKRPHLLDIFWSLGIFISTLITLTVFYEPPNQHTIPLLLLFIWAMRLSVYLLYTRIFKAHTDSRYAYLSKQSLFITTLKQVGFQSILQGMLVTTFYPLLFLDTLHPAFLTLGLFVGGLGIAFESIADYQLYRFKKQHTGICNVGLWQYSRHPNYFFECMVWVGFSIMFIPNLLTLISLIGPFSIFVITYFITGRLTEKTSQLRHGEPYLNYQKNTPYFFPWKGH